MSDRSGPPGPLADPDATLPPPDSPEDAAATLPPPPDLADSPTLTAGGTTPHAAAPPAGGVPGYVIEEELGRGGMGVVYKARQAGLNRPVALKMVLAADRADPRELVRFLAEAEAVAAVRHPNVVQVYDFGDHAGRPFLAMEFLDGGSLADRLRAAGPLPPRDAAALVERLAKAVQAAHDLGIVHRDLKPANILFARDAASGGPDPGAGAAPGSHFAIRDGAAALTPKVTDFGLAKRGNHDLTRTGAIMGTPAYMSPEQAQGNTKFVGPAADVYALGAILYECLAGRPPFQAEDTVGLILKVASEDPEPVRAHAPHVPRDLDLVCLKCLEKEPRKRYATAAALADDLRRFLDGDPISARPATLRERAGRWVRRNPARATAAAAAALLLAAGVGVVVYDARAQQRRADQLQRLTDQAVQARNVAQEQTAAAETEKTRAQLAEAAARAAREDAAARLYETGIDLGHREWLQGNAGRTEQFLHDAPAALRGWEWRYLDGLRRLDALTLVGHRHRVVGLDVSPDGSRVVSCDHDFQVRVWDARSGRQVLAPDRAGGPVLFAPDGKTVFCTRSDAHLLDPESGRTVATLPAADAAAAAFTDGGAHVVTLSWQNGSAAKWSATTGTKVADYPKLPLSLTHAWWSRPPALTPDGRVAVFGHFDGTVKVWDVPAGKQLYASPGAGDAAAAVAVRPDGGVAAAAYPDGAVYLWDVPGKKELRRARPPGGVTALAFSPDGSRLAVASPGGAVRVEEADTGLEVVTVRGHTAAATAVRFTPDGAGLVTGSADGTVRVWRIEDRRHFGGMRKFLMWSAASRIGGDPRALMPAGQLHHRTYYGHAGPARFLTFSPDGDRVATASGDGAAVVWDLRTHAVAEMYGFGPGRGGALAFAPDGKRMAAAAQMTWDKKPGRVVLWEFGKEDPEVMSVRLPGEGKSGEVPAVAFAPDGNHIVASLGGEGAARVRAFAVPSGKEVAAARVDGGGVHTVAFLPGGARVIVGATGSVSVWDWPGLTPVTVVPAARNRCLAVSRGGRVAVGFEDAIRVFEPGQPLATAARELRGHAGATAALAFSPDGDRLVSAGEDQAVKVWNVATGRELLTFLDPGRHVLAVGWSPDGRRVAAGGSDGSLRVWEAPPDPGAAADAWPVVYAERFDGPALPPGWQAGPNWAVEAGALRGAMVPTPTGTGATHAAATATAPARPLPRTVDVRYTVWSPTPRVAGAFLQDPRRGRTIEPSLLAPGHRWGLGQAGVFVSGTAGRAGPTVPPRGNVRVEPGRKYRVRVLRADTRVTVWVDGVEILTEPVPADEAPRLVLSGAWGEPGDVVYFDDLEVRAPAAAVRERDLLDRLEAWGDALHARELVATEIDRAADLSAAEKQFLRGRLSAVAEDPGKLAEAVTAAAYNPGLSPAEAAAGLARAEALVRLTPGNWLHVHLRGVLEYRAGRTEAAAATAERVLKAVREADGSADPGALALLALVRHRQDRPDEARRHLRRALDLFYGEGFAAEYRNARRLADEAAKEIALPADPDRDAICSAVFAAGQRGWLHGDPAGNLAAYADDATATTGRGPDPSTHDVTLGRPALDRALPWRYAATAHKGNRVAYEDVAVRIAGDRAELAYTSTLRVPGYFFTWEVRAELRRTPAGWRIVRERGRPVASNPGGVLTRYDANYYRAADAKADAAKAEGDTGRLVRALLDAHRPREAFAAAKPWATPGAGAAAHWALAEAAYGVGAVDELRAATRAALAADPAAETPWFVSRARGRIGPKPGTIYGLARHPTRPELAAGGSAAVLWQIDPASGETLRELPGHDRGLSDVHYSPDGTRLASTGNDVPGGKLRVRDAATGRDLFPPVQAHAQSSYRLAFRPDGKQILTVSLDRGVKIWDAETGAIVREFAGHDDAAWGCAWSPDPRKVATASRDGTARVWDADTGKELLRLEHARTWPRRVRFSPDGSLLATSGTDGTIYLWDPATGESKGALAGGHRGPIEPIEFTPDGKTLLSGGTEDGRLAIWDVRGRKLREVFHAHGGFSGPRGVYGLAVAADGRSAMTAGTDGLIRVWTLADW